MAILDQNVGIQVDRRFNQFLQESFRPLPCEQLIAIPLGRYHGDGLEHLQILGDHDELPSKHRGI